MPSAIIAEAIRRMVELAAKMKKKPDADR